MIFKTCPKCDEKRIWPWGFVKRKAKGKTRFYNYCKFCNSLATMAWVKANSEKYKSYQRQYYLEHKEDYHRRYLERKRCAV